MEDDQDVFHDSEDTVYDIDVKKETTDYVSRTADSTTTEETIKFKVEELPPDEDFKGRFLEAQDRLGELETELKNTRERLRNLEDACEHTEEKIGVLKNAAFSYHRSFSEHEITVKTVVEENKELKITIEKLQKTIRVNRKDRERTDEIKRNINEQLKEQLDAATKENEDLERQVDELRALNAKNLRDTKEPHDPRDDKKKCKYCGYGENQDGGDLMKELESLKLKFDAMERENDKLEKEKKELRSEVDDLEEKLKHLQIKLSADDEIIEEMKQQILDYHTRIAESEDNCDNSRSRNIELEKEMSVLRGLMGELENKLEDEKESREDLIRDGTQQLELQNKKISQLEMNLKDVCKEKELLNLQFVDSKNKAERDVKQWTKQLNEAHVRAELFKKDVYDKEKQLSVVKVENKELKNEIASLRSQLQDAQDRELSQFAEDLDVPDGDNQMKEENEELKKEVEQLRDEVISLQSELAGLVHEAEESKSAEKKDLEKVVVHHVEVLQSAVPLAQVDEDLSDYDDLDEERVVAVSKTSLDAAPKEAEDSWSSEDYAKSQIQELEELLERAKVEKQKVEDCLEESEDRAKKTTDELSKTIEHLNERCEEIRKELIEKEIVINKLRKDHTQDQNNIRDLEEKLREQEYIEAELEKARQELRELKLVATRDDYREKYEEMEKKYYEIMEDKNKLEKEKEEVSKEKAELKDKLDDMDEKFEKGKKMYAGLCDENDDLKKEKVKLEDEVKFLSEELKEEEDLHVSERDKLAGENNDLKEKIKQLEAEVADLKVKLGIKEDGENWRKKHDDLKREKGSLQSEKKRLERSLERIEDEHEDTKSKYSKARRELSDALAETAMLRRQVSELRLSKDTANVEKELRKVKETLVRKEEECKRHVEELKEKEKELKKVNETLSKKEEECKRHLQELEELKRSLFRQTSEDGWQEKFESLKLQLDEVEDEKNSLQREKNNLQSELRKDSEKLAEVEIKLSQANMEIEGLSKDFHKSHTRITHLEIELQRASKQKQQAEEQAKWIKKELLTREDTISKLGKELNEKNKALENMDADGDKDNEIIILEREIQLLQSRIPASEKDESVLHNQIRLLEDNVKEVQEKLKRKTEKLDECEKKNETLSVRVVELSKEIQSLYRRYEERGAQLAELQAGEPVVPERAETTSLTIDVEGKPEVQLGVFMQERVRSSTRVVTPGHSRSVSEIEVPVSQLPGTVIIGEPVSVTVDYSMDGYPVVSHPTEITASEPEDNDEASLSSESEDEDVPPVVFSAPEVQSAPPQPSYSPPPVMPERILISAQALPGPQVPKSIDAERFPFLKGSNVLLKAGAFQPVPSREADQPEEYPQEDAEEVEDIPLPRRFRATSREELFKLDGLLHAHAHHADPPENGLDNGKEFYPKEPNDQDLDEWPQAPMQPPQEAYSYESAPGGDLPGDFEEYSDPYKMPPRKPESSYTRRIIGVYDNDGNLIGYQEVYEEKTDDYPDEMNVGVVPYPDPNEYRGMQQPYETEQYPSENVPYAYDGRQRIEDDFGHPYDRNGNSIKARWYDQPDERGFVNSQYDRQNDAKYSRGHKDPYGHLNGDDNRRVRPSSIAKHYASGTYL